MKPRSMDLMDAEYRRSTKLKVLRRSDRRGHRNAARPRTIWKPVRPGICRSYRQVRTASGHRFASGRRREKLDGATAEVIAELRSQGGYRGVSDSLCCFRNPRAAETVASGTPSPVSTAPIIDRIFAESVAGKMGARFINIPQGTNEYPNAHPSVAGGWARWRRSPVPLAVQLAYSTA